jgi:iron complex outermembrane receptor protein
LLQKFADKWNGYIDLQYHHVKYDINSFEDNPALLIKNNYDFFNPKVGVSYTYKGWNAYLSYGMASKEPNRDDFEANQNEQPRPERLHDTNWALTRDSPTIVGVYILLHEIWTSWC